MEKELKSRQESREYYTKKFLENMNDKASSMITYYIDGGYCDGYNTVLQAYENLFGIDERYWKLVNYLNENNC